MKFGRSEQEYTEEFVAVLRAYRKGELSLDSALAVQYELRLNCRR